MHTLQAVRNAYRLRHMSLRRAALVIVLLAIVAGFAGLDRLFYRHISQRLNTEATQLDRDFYTRTRVFWLTWRYTFGHALGGAVFYFLIAGLHPQGFRPANCGLFAVLVTALSANLAQGAVGRPRPNLSNGTRPDRHEPRIWPLPHKASFPSSEAATAFAIAAVLRHIWPRARPLFFCGATLAAIARLANGAHYLSDVLAGATFGFFAADALYRLAQARYEQVTGVLVRARPATDPARRAP